MGASRHEIEKDKSPYVLVHTLLLGEEDYLAWIAGSIEKDAKYIQVEYHYALAIVSLVTLGRLQLKSSPYIFSAGT